MATKILITGSGGFIGTNLLAHFGNRYDIETWDLKDGCDIFLDAFEPMVKWADVVIHLAALTSVEQSFKDPGKTHVVNVLGTARVSYLCEKYKKKIIFPSSAAIYHPELSPYARSKQLAEDVVRGISDHTPVTVLRLYNVFGPHMNPNSGSIMYRFLADKEIVIYGDGEQTRDYIHVRDVVRIMEAAIKKKWDGRIVDVGMGDEYSVNYVAGLFSQFRGIPISYKTIRREIKWSKSNPTILKLLYSRKLTTNLEKDIKELCIHLSY